DQMPAEAAGGCQGLFQVDLAASLEIDKGGARQGFAADIGPETVTRQLHRGQADAVDGNAVAKLDVAQVELAGLNQHPNVAALGRDRANGADGFDYSCEHAASRGRLKVTCI